MQKPSEMPYDSACAVKWWGLGAICLISVINQFGFLHHFSLVNRNFSGRKLIFSKVSTIASKYRFCRPHFFPIHTIMEVTSQISLSLLSVFSKLTFFALKSINFFVFHPNNFKICTQPLLRSSGQTDPAV